MAYEILQTPGSYYSAHGDIIFTVCDIVKAADPVTYPDFRYVCDVYIGSDFVVRLKAYPRPDNKIGVFDVGNIIRDYVSANFNPTASQLKAQESGSGEFFVTATMKFGYEYDFTLYTNVTVDSARVYFNHYNGRMIGDNTILSDYLDKPLTTRPLTGNTVELTDAFCFLPFLPTDTDVVSVNVQTATQSLSASVTPSAANVLQLLNVSPVALNAAAAGLITVSDLYYTVQVLSPNITGEPTYRFDITCEPKYETYRLHFLNRFGGFETYSFRKVSRKTIDIQKSDFGKLPYTVSNSGVVSYKNSNNVYNETRAVYSSQFTEKMVLNTDILTDDEYSWLADLFQSPLVYIEMESHFIPCLIKDSNYEFRKVINDKLTNITLNIEFGDRFSTQFR